MNKVPVIIEALCYLLVKLKKIDKIHLVKLMYLADKYHLMNYGRTISGDDFVAFKNGPAGSKTVDILEFDSYVLDKELERAKQMFKKGKGHQYLPGEKCSLDQLEMLSETDLEALDFAITNFGTMDKWDVVKYTHKLQEWKQFEDLFKKHQTTKESIKVEQVLYSPNDKYFSVTKDHLEESLQILTGTFD